MKVQAARSALLLCVALAFAAAPAAADSFAKAQKLAFEGSLNDAIGAAKKAFDSSQSAHDGRLLQDLLEAAGRGAERETIMGDSTPRLVYQGLAVRILDPKAATSALKSLVKADGAPPIFRLDLVRALLGADRVAAACSEADRYVKEFPDSAEGHALLGKAWVARKKPGQARRAFTRALEVHAGHPEAALGLAALLAASDDEDARPVLTKALGTYPGNPALRHGLADDQEREGEFEAATETLTGLLQLATPKAYVHMRLAEVWRARKEFKKSAASASTALADRTLVGRNRARAMRALAFAKQKQGDMKGARQEYLAALDVAPEWAQLHADFGFALALSEDLEGAIRCLEHALDLDDELLDAHLKYGVALQLFGKAKKAKKQFSLVLKQDDNHVPANRYMGYLLLEEGKPKTALKYFQRVADRQSDSASGVRMVGRCYMAMGKIDDALNAFQLAVDRDPKDGFAHFDLGKAHQKKEAWDEAEAAFKKAIENDATLSHPHLYLAELLHFVRDKPADALPHYRKYLELGGHDEADAIQKRVEQIEDDEADEAGKAGKADK